MSLKRFQFIKVTNNNDHKEFYVDITTMKDARLRISALKAQYKKYINDGKNFKPIFKYFNLDYSFCVLERGDYEKYEDVKSRRDELYLKYREKLSLSCLDESIHNIN